MIKDQKNGFLSPAWFEQTLDRKGIFLTFTILTLLISGPACGLFFSYRAWQRLTLYDSRYTVRQIVQTGEIYRALPSDYLAELIGLSSDHPISIARFNRREAEERLKSSPLIKQARVYLRYPNTVYIDYTARRPIAFLADYENIALDEEGFIFPVKPFLTPKNLPEIYLGLAPFGEQGSDSALPVASWKEPLSCRALTLALTLLKTTQLPEYRSAFHVTRLDLSKAFAGEHGVPEVVLESEDKVNGGIHMRCLRLTPAGYAQELGNYLELRGALLEREAVSTEYLVTTIDLRIPQLAFLSDSAPHKQDESPSQ